jgi:hypothetical protein
MTISTLSRIACNALGKEIGNFGVFLRGLVQFDLFCLILSPTFWWCQDINSCPVSTADPFKIHLARHFAPQPGVGVTVVLVARSTFMPQTTVRDTSLDVTLTATHGLVSLTIRKELTG